MSFRSLRNCSVLAAILSSSQGFSLELQHPQTDSTFLISLWTEANAAFLSRNDVEIPKGDATRFSLTPLGKGPVFAGRVYGSLAFGNHKIRVLAAPLSINTKGKLNKEVNYQGKIFSQELETKALYRFDSYRITYAYQFYSCDTLTLTAGLTGKIRDAEIKLTQSGISATRTNTGFVPLLHFSSVWQYNETFGAMFDADALVSPYGRAEDIALLFTARVFDGLEGRLGYRMVEGGSDGSKGKVYNFTWIHSVAAGLSATWGL